MFSVQCSVFSVQCSVFSVQCSVFSETTFSSGWKISNAFFQVLEGFFEVVSRRWNIQASSIIQTKFPSYVLNKQKRSGARNWSRRAAGDNAVTGPASADSSFP